ncbi:unnamed protein product, partial [Ostreobium quekettii]
MQHPLRACSSAVLAFVKTGVNLTIEAGVTVRATAGTPAAALVIERGAKIFALGTQQEPITFTSATGIQDPNDPEFDPATARGRWGGLIILGNAPIIGGENSVEGLPEGMGLYGGNDPDDSSGVLRFVRVWFGGSEISPDNEINGITFAGVGRGTEVDHIEVAYNLDDGVEFFGGTVNAKFISVLFCGDDGIDTDEGYQGKLQFVFVITGTSGHHGFEMDSVGDETPRSSPQIYNVLIVGGSTDPGMVTSDQQKNGLIRLREGTGAHLGNLITVNVADKAVWLSNCTDALTVTQDIENRSGPDTLYFSPGNMLGPHTAPVRTSIGCRGKELRSWSKEEPNLVMVAETINDTVLFIDPRPRTGSSPVYRAVDDVPADFFTPVDYRGAFGEDLWLSGWSLLDEFGLIPDNVFGEFQEGVIQSDATWRSDTLHLLADQVFVASGATLTIQPGAVIKAYRDNGSGRAPSLVIERGAKILAEGRADRPITFTSVLNPRHLPARGTWGGVVILGNGLTSKGVSNVEGLEGVEYGGNNPDDDSGVLTYVRVWYGGDKIAPDNEINGVTFGAVGARTVVDHLEVA